MPKARKVITASSNSILRMSGTRVPAGIVGAGGEANDSPGSGPLSVGDLEAWIAIRPPESSRPGSEDTVDAPDEQPTIDTLKAMPTATAYERRYGADMSEGRRIGGLFV